MFSCVGFPHVGTFAGLKTRGDAPIPLSMTITRDGRTVTITGDWRIAPDTRTYATEHAAREAERAYRRAARRLVGEVVPADDRLAQGILGRLAGR